MYKWVIFALLVGLSYACPGKAQQAASKYFVIEVVDEADGRGVPMVELTTTDEQRFYTDSAGLVAFDEPGLMNQRVFFKVSSPGYEYAADGFGMRGKALQVVPGGSATLKIKRVNIAQRMYRITGQGIYVHSARAGRKAPLKQPLLSGKVTGQDSALAAVYRGRVYHFWGDTNRPAYPLGNFSTSAATSLLPKDGGLDPSRGIDLDYFVDDKGFSKPMFTLGKPGPVWVDGVTVLKDDKDQPRLITHYSRMKNLGTVVEHGLAEFDDETKKFEVIKQLPAEQKLHPRGHALYVRHGDTDYIYFANPYPLVRVEADWKLVTDPTAYESFTCLKTGSRFDIEKPALDRAPGDDGKLIYAWKRNTEPVYLKQQQQLIRRGHIKADESWIRTRNAQTDKPIQLHGGSVRYNAFRDKWIMIAVQAYGAESFLGEVWYSEADAPHGPWDKAIKVASHPKYDYYNPVHHDFYDREGGRYIYFEGTYVNTFSGTKVPTPRYNYNQLMYRLDLADKRLRAIDP